jgi:hypothetical protein
LKHSEAKQKVPNTEMLKKMKTDKNHLLPFTDMSYMSGHGRSEKNKLLLLTCQCMEDLRKTNYRYWHVRAWKIWEKQITVTDMSVHGRSEKNKLPLLTYQGMEDLRKINYLYWHVRAWKIWEKQNTLSGFCHEYIMIWLFPSNRIACYMQSSSLTLS